MSDSNRPPGASSPPKYCRQKRKDLPDRAYVWSRGKKVYLGEYGTEQSRAEYAELIVEVPGDPPLPEPTSDNPTVSELLVLFLRWASSYYDAREYGHFMTIAGWLRDHAGKTKAKEFGPRRLKEIRQAMIEHGWTRKGINRQVVRIRQVFTWAVGEEIIPATNQEALRAVKGLREGRSGAREKEPIRPVSDEDIRAAQQHLSTKVSDMVEVHRLTGCRPAELVSMRPDQIDRSGSVWIYSPGKHKNTWREKSRKIPIGPKAQAILRKYLFGDWCFTSQADHGKPEPYLGSSYRRAIARACTRAKIHPWTPGQLRHSTATKIRREFGLEEAQVVLGHSTASTTEIYAERDMGRAIEVARKMG